MKMGTAITSLTVICFELKTKFYDFFTKPQVFYNLRSEIISFLGENDNPNMLRDSTLIKSENGLL